MRILVTGAAGFIGSNLAIALLNRGYKVIAIDNFMTGFQYNIDEIQEHAETNGQSFTFHKVDIRDFDACQRLMQGVDAVIHQAALGSVPRSLDTPHLTTDVNVTGFVNILTAAQQAGIKKFVYASSSSVYGDSPDLPKQEQHQGNLLSPYAASKYTNEIYGKVFADCYGMSIIGLRYFNVFGPRQSPQGPYAAVIPIWISAFISGNPIYINGDGETSRDFTYIENAVIANLQALTSSLDGHHIFNIAAGAQTSLNQLYAYIQAALNKQGISPIYRDFRAGDVRHSLADISQAQNLLDYTPTIQVDAGLKETVTWYLQRAGQ